MREIEDSTEIQPFLQDFLDQLNPKMCFDIMEYISHNKMLTMSIFESVTNIEVAFVASRLTSSMFVPEEFVIEQDDEAHHLYIIFDGSVNVILRETLMALEKNVVLEAWQRQQGFLKLLRLQRGRRHQLKQKQQSKQKTRPERLDTQKTTAESSKKLEATKSLKTKRSQLGRFLKKAFTTRNEAGE